MSLEYCASTMRAHPHPQHGSLWAAINKSTVLSQGGVLWAHRCWLRWLDQWSCLQYSQASWWGGLTAWAIVLYNKLLKLDIAPKRFWASGQTYILYVQAWICMSISPVLHVGRLTDSEQANKHKLQIIHTNHSTHGERMRGYLRAISRMMKPVTELVAYLDILSHTTSQDPYRWLSLVLMTVPCQTTTSCNRKLSSTWFIWGECAGSCLEE